jgi:hypothetical protein
VTPEAALTKSFESNDIEPGHKTDWLECLGVVKPPEKFIENLKTFSDQIDEVKDIRRKLKEEYGLTLPTHRFLFHWGFNNNPENNQAINKEINKIKIKLSTEKKEALFNYLKVQQKKRNKKMITQVEASTLPPPLSKALTTVLYNVHILGDFSSTQLIQIQFMLDIQGINRDIKINGIERMHFDKTEEKEFKAALDKAVSYGGSDKDKATNIIETIKCMLPELLYKHYRNTLEKNGIHIKKPEPKKTKEKLDRISRQRGK